MTSSKRAGRKAGVDKIVLLGFAIGRTVRVFLIASASLLLCFGAKAATNEFLPDEPSPWDTSLNLRPGFGYKDNLALSRTNREDSVFVSTELDLAVLRLPLDGRQFTAFITGEDTRFLEGEEIRYEQYLAAVSEFKMDLGAHWNASALVQYVYQNQIVDVSTIERTLGPVRVEGHRLGVWPATFRRDLSRNFWLQAETRVHRQFFKEPLDDYWEPGGRVTFGSDYGFRSTASLNYEIKQLIFDTREQAASDGTLIPGKPLRFTQHDAELMLRHNLDARRRWRSFTRLSFQANTDNGSGFYDYYRYQVSQQMSYVAHSWDLRASARASYYDFSIQPATLTDGSTRAKTLVTFSLRAEKRLVKQLKLFAEWEHERSISNRPVEEYFVNKVVGGIDFEL